MKFKTIFCGRLYFKFVPITYLGQQLPSITGDYFTTKNAIKRAKQLLKRDDELAAIEIYNDRNEHFFTIEKKV